MLRPYVICSHTLREIGYVPGRSGNTMENGHTMASPRQHAAAVNQAADA